MTGSGARQERRRAARQVDRQQQPARDEHRSSTTATRPRQISRQALARAMSIEIVRLGAEVEVDRLALPGVFLSDIRDMTRGMSRDDCVRAIAHMALLTRHFAAAFPAGKVDEILADLASFDAGVDSVAGSGPEVALTAGLKAIGGVSHFS